MIKSNDILVVVPAYNEVDRVGTVLSELTSRGYQVVCVDDGSTDDTFSEIRRSGVVALQHCINLGAGAALATGFRYAETADADFIVTFDADGQHSVDDIEPAVKALMESEADLLMASRFIGTTEDMPFSRRLTLKAATLFTRLTSGLDVTDAHNGFRVFRRSCISLFRLKQNRMAHASELYAVIRNNDLDFIEFPNHVRYTEETLRKGQKMSGAFSILSDLAVGRMYR